MRYKELNINEYGVGIVTKQNATKDVPVGGEYMNVKKLGLDKKPKKKTKSKLKNEAHHLKNPKNTFLTKADTAYDFIRVGKTISNLKNAPKDSNRDEPDVMVVPYGGKKEKDHLKKGLNRVGYKTQDADKDGDDAHVDEAMPYTGNSPQYKGVRIPTDDTVDAKDITKKSKQVDMPVDTIDDFDFSGVDGAKLKKVVAKLVSELPGSPKNIKVLQARLGLAPFQQAFTLQQIADAMDVTPEVIRQREAKAIRMLKHPTRARELRPFLEAQLDEAVKKCKDGEYYCNTDQKCKPIPKGYHVMPDGELMKDGEPHESLREALGEIKKNSEIYVDMDGVLADFFGEWSKSQGVDNWKDIKDPAQAIGDIKDIDDFWLNLPLLPKAKELLGLIKQVKGSYSICTSPLADDPRSEPHKREWIKNNLSFFLPKNVFVTHNKAQFSTQKDGTPNILIDDYGVNIDSWEKAGGIGFKYKDYKFQRTAKAIKNKIEEPATENFADGKKKGKSRPGRVKKSGASCKGSVTDLRKRAKGASGEKRKMYHWCANMKSGKK